MIKCALLACCLLLASDCKLDAHFAPSGWQYPPECCGGSDCWPVDCNSIVETEGGYLWQGLFYTLDKVKLSPDKQCHACAGLVSAKPHEPRCLFIRPMV